MIHTLFMELASEFGRQQSVGSIRRLRRLRLICHFLSWRFSLSCSGLSVNAVCSTPDSLELWRLRGHLSAILIRSAAKRDSLKKSGTPINPMAAGV